MSRLFRIFALCALIIAALGTPTTTRAQDASAHLTCRIEPSPLALNEQATLILEIANVQNLYGYELKMTYDGSRVQVQDADSAKDGINLQLAGGFVSPDFVVFNSADNGLINLALTQLSPSPAKSGSGELVRVAVAGIGAGFANFAFGDLVFSDTNGRAIPVTKEDCLVEIGEAGQPTPTATSAPTATPTNTQTPTQQATVSVSQQSQSATATPLPPAPTATPTGVPATPTETLVAADTATATPLPTETPTAPAIITTPTPRPEMADTDATQLADVPPTETVIPSQESAPSQPPVPTAAQETPIPSTLEGEAESESDPQNDTQEMSASGKESEQVAMVESEPTATPTPVVIDRVAQAAPLAVASVQQPGATEQSASSGLLQGRGWFFLVLTLVLALAAWRLRRGSPGA